MQFLARMSPLRAVRDLRFFLQQRERHELVFFFLAILATTALLTGFWKNSGVEKEYRPQIIYVQQWRLDRTDAEIKAQQAIDAPIKQARIDAEKKRQDELRAQFKRLDDKLESWGI
ncbi:hypothetical protein [Sphingomonas radiodurans]|uniref:hypothetical protein n=1 Tax=Sphingomonas radiodurans TaxID=2890321 RepID=UPI001E633EC6|nr:hypothetical protein [Sphingomonas radiodurans]WBH15465.1 hypothetical protein LLW23_11530 [Sphingomonas radiodurans]